jgi:hypothetical protein
MTTASTEVATTKPAGAVATYDYAAFAGAGFEQTTAADFKPSFLRILHGTSPQIETVEGAKPGLIIDTITNEVFTEVVAIPCAAEHVFAAWKPRDPQGGGSGGDAFGGIFKLDDPSIQAALAKVGKYERGDDGKIVLPEIEKDGAIYQLIETRYFHCIQVRPNGSLVPVTLAFSSTGHKPATSWLTMMNNEQMVMPNGELKPLPFFAHAFKLGVNKTERGTLRWYNFAPSWANGKAGDSRLDPASPQFRAAVAVYQAWIKGKVDVDYAAAGQGESSDGSGAGKGKGKNGADAEIPF